MNEKSLESKAGKLLGMKVTRRQALKAGGVAAIALAFSKPVIESFRPAPAFASGGVMGGNMGNM